jgi:transcriptional regulator with XRE-family HTH domain
MADYRERMAKRIRESREAQSLSRDDLAYKAGVSAKTIKRIEEQKTTARPITVRNLAEGLGLDPSELRPSPEWEADQLRRIEANVALILRVLAEVLAEDLRPELDAEIRRVLQAGLPSSQDNDGSRAQGNEG